MKTILTIAILFCSVTLFAQAGAIDSGFGNAGKFIFSNNYPAYINGINAAAIQPDGKIVLAGYGYNYSGNSSADFAVIRLTKDGFLDSSFGYNGLVFIDFSNDVLDSSSFGSTYDVAYGIAIQPNGKIVIAGTANGYAYIPATNTNNYSDFAVARINADGSLDNNFNGNGKKLIDLSAFTSLTGFYNNSYDYCSGVAIKSNGKIVLAGNTYTTDPAGNNYDAAAVQLNKNGSLDLSFNKSGIDVIKKQGSDENISGTVVQQDGKIVFGGTTSDNFNGTSNLLAIRLNTGGAPDSTFDGDGFAITNANAYSANGSSIALQTDGKILIGGSAVDSTTEVALVRFTANGALDNSFNGNGVSLRSRPGEHDNGGSLCIQKDGKIIQAGNQYFYSQANIYYNGATNFLVLRYNSNGTTDSSFGNRGRSIIDFGNWTNEQQDYSTACAVQQNGKIIVAGFTNNSVAAVTRLLSTGKNTSLSGPSDQSAAVPANACTATFNNIDPVLTPDTSLNAVKYYLYHNNNYYPSSVPYDSGYGSVSKKPFDIGNTAVVYTLIKDQLQRSVFSVNVTGGTPAGALDFDGIDDRVDVSYLNPVSNDTYGQYSFEGWIKVHAYNQQEGSVIFGDERNNNGGILVELNNKGYITTYQPSVGNVVSSYKVALNKWTHIAFVQSASKLDLYVNGNFVQTLLTAPNLQVSTYSNFYLGAYTTDYTNFSRHFDGEMDEVRVWGRAICPGQIQNNLHCEIPNYPSGLDAYFNFNEGLASCKNLSVTSLNGGNAYGYLQNFALNGPTSNWVAGHISGSCVPFAPLTINCPNNINQQVDPGMCSAIVNFAVSASSGCSDSVIISYSQNPGTSFPVGTTYVYVTAQDVSGNTATCQFPVTISETTPPYLTTKTANVSLDYNGNAYLNSPYDVVDSVSDNCGLNYYNGLNVYPTYFNCSNAGANIVTVTATDASGNSTTKYATVNVLAYQGSSALEVIPNPQQYSDVATLKATLYGAANFYYNGCLPGGEVTFKIGNKVVGTSSLSPDPNYYNNLSAMLDYPILTLGSKKVTAIFKGVNTAVYTFNNPDTATLTAIPENAVLDYVGAQIIQSTASQVTIPVAATLTDTADGFPGDIRNAVATFTIQPVTSGASIIGANTITVPALQFVNSDHTSGVARTNFTVSTGGNANTNFTVSLVVSNYYTGNISVPVLITKQKAAITSVADAKAGTENTGFNVIVSPNPSQDHYTIQVQSSNQFDKISIKISDITGKIIETFTNINTSDIIKLGYKYAAGTYVAEITQGQNKKVFKLIKL